MQKKNLVGILVIIVICVAYLLNQNRPDLVSERNQDISGGENTSVIPNAYKMEWVNYSSPQGVSFKYPKEVFGFGCDGKNGLTPVRVLEDPQNGYIYIADNCSDTLESLQNETKQLSAGNQGYKQEKTYYGWGIAVKDAKNDNEINSFISSHYGTGSCEAGERKLLDRQDWVYDITINGKDWNTAPDMQSGCTVNYSYKVLFASDKNKALSVVLGQECTFA